MSRRAHIEAAKVGVAVATAIIIALWWGWEKPYWAGITVIVLCGTETVGHSFRKARYRLLGTFFGVIIAWTLIGWFAQSPLMFIACYITFVAICCFFSFSVRYGYIFVMTCSVSTVICFSGGLDIDASIHVSILRLQETLLGVVCYSAVFTFIYPVTTESVFLHRFQRSLEEASKRIELLCELLGHEEQADVKQGVENYKLDDEPLKNLMTILTLPLTESYLLRFKVRYWQAFIYGLIQTYQQYNQILNRYRYTELSLSERKLAAKELMDVANRLSELRTALINLDVGLLYKLIDGRPSEPKNASALLMSIYELHVQFVDACSELKRNYRRFMSKNEKPKAQWQAFAPKSDYSKAFYFSTVTILILIACFSLWYYLPIPMGFVFPMLVGSMVLNIVIYPSQVIGKTILAIAIWSILPLLQFIFVLPQMSEAWQLWGFYFINLFVLWTIFSKREQAISRLLGSMMLVIITMNATNLVPVYDVTASLTVLLCLFIFLMVARTVAMVCETLKGTFQSS